MSLDDRTKEYKRKRFPKMYDDFLSNFEMSIRTATCLESLGIYTIQELLLWRESDLLEGRNMGRKSVAEIKEILSSLNLKLRKEYIA